MSRYSDAVEQGYDGDDPFTEARNENAYRNALMVHPDCRDPDHPGCDDCKDGDE